MPQVILYAAVAVVAVMVLLVGLNAVVVLRMRALKGKPLPDVPGPIGQRLIRAKRALAYFFSPGCAACVRTTPILRRLSEKNRDVHVIDISRNLDIARALGILATPTLVEVEAGRIVQIYVGQVPSQLIERYAQ